MAEHEPESEQISPQKKREKPQAPVVNYIAILFIAAFLLLLMTYLMEQRQSAEALDGLRNSVSAMQSVEEVYEKNSQLLEENNQLEQDNTAQEREISRLETEQQELESKLDAQTKSHQALSLLWEAQEALAVGEESLAIELILAMEEAGLEQYLSSEIALEEGISPYQRYLEICEMLEIHQEEETEED